MDGLNSNTENNKPEHTDMQKNGKKKTKYELMHRLLPENRPSIFKSRPNYNQQKKKKKKRELAK